MPAVRKNIHIVLLLISLILAASFLISRRVCNLKSGEELGVDVFYHMTMADGGPVFCIQRTFPHTDMSVWKDHFYNKELFFHLFLSAIRHWGIITGFSTSAPFHFPAAALIVLNLGVFGFLAYRADAKYAFLWPLLYVTLSPGFTNRLLMVRPHNFAIIILLAAAWSFSGITKRRDLGI